MSNVPTITDLADQFRSGQNSVTAALSDCLGRIDRFEPDLQAWVVVERDAALQEADRLDQMARKGDFVGPLHGISVGIKDIINVDGLPTLAGSPLRKQHRAACDAPVVVRLKQAGAIILGKTVTTELAYYDPPPTRNPWNLEHTPGGSSSGSAAAVALGMCGVAIGSQTGGSIIRPASYCGVSGFKPSFGLIDRTGVVPVSRHLDHLGPIGRSVADLALVFSVVAGDRTPFETRTQRPRLGLFESFFIDRAETPVREAIWSTIESLRRQGADLKKVDLPDGFDMVHRMHARVMAYEAAQVHGNDFQASPQQFGPAMSSLLEEGLATSEEQFHDALRHRYTFEQNMAVRLEDIDAVITPATNSTAPDLTTTGSPMFNSPFSYAGLPTVSIPCAVSGKGLPIAIQLVGRRDEDHALLELAAWCEKVIGFEERPPLCDDEAIDTERPSPL